MPDEPHKLNYSTPRHRRRTTLDTTAVVVILALLLIFGLALLGFLWPLCLWPRLMGGP